MICARYIYILAIFSLSLLWKKLHWSILLYWYETKPMRTVCNILCVVLFGWVILSMYFVITFSLPLRWDNCADGTVPMKQVHYGDDIMSAIRLKSTTSLLFTQPFVQAKSKKSPASLAFVRGNHRSPVNSPHKAPVMRKIWWRHHDNPD